MVTRKAIAILGAPHVSGAAVGLMSPGGQGADSTGQWLPAGLQWGTAGYVRIGYAGATLTNGPFARNQIITGGTSAVKGRVIEVLSSGELIVERLSFFAPIAGVVAGFRPLEVITADNSPATSATASYVVEHDLWVSSGAAVLNGARPTTMLASRLVNQLVPADAAANIFWDREARLAATLPVANGAAVTTHFGTTVDQNGIGRIEGATSGARALVVRVEGNTLHLANVVGTFTNGENLRPVGGSTLTTVAGTITTKTAGEWVPYAARPNLNGIGRGWEVPPAGGDTAYRAGSLGIEPRLIELAHQRWGSALAAIKLDVNGPNSGNASGYGGVTYGLIKCSGTFPTSLTLGNVVTSAGGFSATLVAYDVAAKFLWVKATNGTVLSAGTVTIGTGGGAQTATAIGNVLGWMKGASHYQLVLAEISASAAKLPGGDTLDWTEGFVFLDSVEGDIGAPFPNFTTSICHNPTDIVAAWRQFAVDIRASLAAPNLVVVGFAHRSDYRSATKPNVSLLHRIAIRDAGVGDSRLRLAIADEDLFPASVSAPGAVTTPAEVVYLEPATYPKLGELIWSAFSVASQTLATGDMSPGAVVLITGTSQMHARVPIGYWDIEDDPELAKVSSLNGTNTLDANIVKFNDITGVWEPYSVRDNACTFGDQVLNACGPEVSLLNRLKARYGKIYCIKVAHNGAAMSPTPSTGYATWANVARVSVTATVAVTIPQAGRGRFTAASGAPFGGGLWTANAFVQIAGNDGGTGGAVGTGGNNTFSEPTAVPLQILAVDPGGTWIEVAGSFVADASSSTTFTKGPLDLRRIAGAQIARAMEAMVVQLRVVPRHVATITWDGENDCAAPGDYINYALGHIDWCRSVFGHKIGNEPDCPHVWLKVTRNTPFDPNEDRQNVDAIRAAQDQLATQRENVVVLDTTDLPLKKETGTWPRLTYADYGGHHTPSAAVKAGYRADGGLDGFAWIPSHPSGPVTTEQTGYPEVGGSGGGDSESVTAESGDTAVAAAAAADANADALAEAPDVASYTTPSGLSVQRRTVDEQIKLDAWQQHRSGRGIRNTLVAFE